MELLNFKDVKLEAGYLKDKLDLVREKTLDAVWDRFCETGRVGAYECKMCVEHPVHIFWDSDVIKWAEGAAYFLAVKYDKELDDKINMLASLMEKNATSDGYFNSYYAVHPEQTRFTNRNNHELYCAGHLFEASVAYYEATGNDRLIKISSRFADCIHKIFVEEKSASFTTPGHEEIEIGLMRLYRTTKDKKYLELAKFFINNRGLGIKENKTAYDQSHMPVREMREAVGHAVRACYLYTAMADFASETNDAELAEACKALFDNIYYKKMYVTGGIGSTKLGEAFTEKYDLPNEFAYAETCAAISLLFFATQMQKLEINSKYADVAERAIYNGILSGLSLDGESFFYTNPLEINLRERRRYHPNVAREAFPITQRVRVFSCSCCPPNIVRLFPSIGSYAYGLEGDTLYINQYIDSIVNHENINVKVSTNYPIDGKITVKASGVEKIAFRIPGWCDDFTIDADYTIENGYAIVSANKEITLNFCMPVKMIKANPKVSACKGKVAFMRGPVVYCAEGVDNDFDIFSLNAGNAENFTLCESFGGLPTIEANISINTSSSPLYGQDFDVKKTPQKIKLIPYNAFANRGESDMTVWINE